MGHATRRGPSTRKTIDRSALRRGEVGERAQAALRTTILRRWKGTARRINRVCIRSDRTFYRSHMNLSVAVQGGRQVFALGTRGMRGELPGGDAAGKRQFFAREEALTPGNGD